MPKVHIQKKGRFTALTESKVFRWCFALSLLFILITVALPLWRLFPDVIGKEVVPLHYNIHYGVDWTGVWWQLFLLPASGLGVVILNALMAFILIKREKMLVNVAMISSVILTAFLFLAMVFVVLLNITYG